MKFKLALLCGLALAGANAMACYTVYDSNSRVLYQGNEAPVDMSLQLHEALAARGFPAGSRMQFDQAGSCRPVSAAEVPRPTGTDVAVNTIRLERSARTVARGAPSPLFTDRDTAIASKLPHMQVAGDIVMVPPQAADRAIRPTVTVIPATMVARAPSAPDTRVLGAGPASYNMTSAPMRRQVVITEMRDPPMTVTNANGDVTISN
ncbi:MAG: hypothetical protein JWQ76_500 [Ramlibacter sp.]|nr:hypothetical protein [Ramlibacter sp.]